MRAGAAAGAVHTVATGALRAPAPFRAFAVRSDEPSHDGLARAPYARVHRVQGCVADAAALAALAAPGRSRMDLVGFPDIDYAATTWAELAQAAPQLPDLPGQIAAALLACGVLGADAAACRRSLAGRVDHLGCRGAGFHNDVAGHWPRCLFWLLALDLADVELVLPHAGLRVALAPGDLLVFDPTLAHGLCRPADNGQALAASFDTGVNDTQWLLTGELPLGNPQWAALGSPWLPLQQHAQRGALDLRVASFDERSGAVQRLGALRGGMGPEAGPSACPPD